MKCNITNLRFVIVMCLAASAALAMNTQVAAQFFDNEWFVDDDALDDNGLGNSWDDPFKTLQRALDEAAGTIDESDLILVAQGEYFPTEPAVPGDPDARAVTFYLFAPELNNVEIQGGYKGCPGGVCENPDDRDIEQYETILSGSIFQPEPGAPPCDAGAGDCHLPNGSPGCNDADCCSAVCDANPACCTIMWDATCVTIANGLCPTTAYHVVTADGVNNSVVLSGFTITEGGVPDIGVGIDTEGGGMLILNASLTVTDCTFTANYSNSSGGGMMIKGASPAEIRRCAFIANTARQAGGAMAIVNVIPGPTVILSEFTANTADLTGGGAIEVTGTSDVTVINSTFHQNSAPSGGAIETVQGMMAAATLINCLITGNSAEDQGGGINAQGRVPSTLINSTISDNTVSDGPGGGIFIHTVLEPTVITNSIIWGNSPDQIVDASPSPYEVVVSYTDVQGGWLGTGNINADPMFIFGRGFYQLSSGSLCIDAADNTAVPPDTADLNNDGDTDERTPLDLDLNSRFIDDRDTDDTGVPDPPDYPDVIDMGAYEFVFVPGCPWDLDGSGDVGILDLLALLAAWGPNPGDPADFDGDGMVGILDLLTLLAHWGACLSGGVAGDSLEEVLNEAGLSLDDWDLLLDTLQNGTNEEIDNTLCWFGRYINGCPVDCSLLPACGGEDPFNECPGDFTGALGVPDCTVDAFDLAHLLAFWGRPDGDLTGDCTTDGFDLARLLSNWGACPLDPLCGPGPELTCGESAQGGGGSEDGSDDDGADSSPSLTAALAQMGFDSVGAYQDWLIAASDSEAFASTSLLQVLLEAQP